MIYPSLVDYIRNSLEKNIPLPQIKQSLLEKRWRESDINEAITLINQPPVEMKSNTKNNEPAKKIPLTFILIVVGVLVLILVIGMGGYFLFTMTPTISDNEISQGASVSISLSKEVKFNINEEEHRIMIDSLDNNSVDITIYSTPIEITLNIGQTEKFDLNSDDVYDLSVKLNNITNQKVNLYIKKISEAICTEEWECTNWTICADSTQTRTCTDINECETEESKPDESQECIEVELSCSEKNGTICEIYEECDGTLEDGCCLEGNCTRIPTTICGADIDCLISASNTCHPANMTHNFTIDMGILGWIQSHSYYYKIGRLEDEECEFYQKILNVNGSYTETAKQSFRDDGKTDGEIIALEEEQNDLLADTIGYYGSCNYSTSELKDYLTDVKEGTFASYTEEEKTNYECTGNLYE